MQEYVMDSSPKRGAPRPDAPRLAPVASVTDEIEEILAGSIKSVNGEHLRLFGTLAHHPKLLKRFLAFGGFFLNRGLLPAREREIVILRVGWNTESVYEFGQHTVIGQACGLSDDEIRAVAGDPSSHPWSARDRALIAVVDDICRDDCARDSVWAELRGQWNDAELCELVLLIGMYRMVAGFLNTMGVELDPNTPGWPA